MIFKFARVQTKDHTKDGHLLSISTLYNLTTYSLKSMRKIRNKVSNFFGQTISLPLSIGPVYIIIHQINKNEERSQLFQIQFKIQEQNKNQKCYGTLISQNQKIKLYWSWELQSLDSRQSSEFSRDTLNIETPRKSLQDEQESIFYQLSTKNNFQKGKKLNLQDSKSQRWSSFKKIRNNRLESYKIQQKLQNQQNFKSMVKSKSVVTLTNTPTKVQHLKKSLPISKIENKKKVDYRKNLLNKTIRPKQKSRMQNFHRRNSLNLNKFGAALASTVGVFAGILAGMAASSY